MEYRQQVKQAFSNLFANKLRSFLAVLGILVGTASVVALISSGELATQKALEQFKLLGTDLLSMSLYEARPAAVSTPENTLSLDEAFEMSEKISGIREVAPYISGYSAMAYKGKHIEGIIIGTTDALKRAIKIQMQTGGFISYLDHYEKFCVIGYDIYHQLQAIDKQNPIGKQILLGDRIFTIIGVAKKWRESAFFNADVNRAIFIPIRAMNLVSQRSTINNIVLLLKANISVDKLQSEISAYLQTTAPALKIFYRSPKQIIESMQAQSKIFTILLGSIGGISLLVGGIGVMNIMLVSVTERRREIGIRKAIGARARDIQLLFLFEAIVLALFGGVVGVAVGIVASLVIAYFADWGFGVFLLPPLIGFCVSAATGVFFGFYPAYRAARLNPIAALRYE